MAGRATSTGLAGLALGAALAAGGAQARATDPEALRLTDPDALAGADAAEAQAQGRAELAAGRLPEALKAFRQALAANPDSIEALNGIAVTFDRLGRFEDARTHYEAALSLDPASPMLLANYGISLALQGEDARARRFLQLAAATDDPDVQAASQRALARLDRQAMAAPAVAQPGQPQGPAVVRTSGHEQRLVLAPARAAGAVQMASALPADRALLTAALGGLGAADDARIADTDARARAAEELALAREAAAREAARIRSEALAMIPADMQVAALLQAARAAAREKAEASTPEAEAWGRPRGPVAAPSPADDWYRDQILVLAPAPGSATRRGRDHSAITTALLASGLAPPPPRAATPAPAAPLPARPRRQFEAPFASDDGRLNAFAGRVQARETADTPPVAEQVARLQALLQRMGAA